jgi:hypothetical protein
MATVVLAKMESMCKLSDMESSRRPPSRDEAASALAAAEASRTALAAAIVVPSALYESLGAAIAVQVATAAVGLGSGPVWVLVAGLMVFAAVGGVQLVRFRRANGLWLGGFAGRVVLGTGTAASISYAVALGIALWAALDGWWWLVGVVSIAEGVAYGLAGRRWMETYRAEPATHGPGESAAWLALVSVAAVAGLALLVAGR